MMELNLIKKPVITEKSTANAQFNKYIFEVNKAANKSQIKATIEDIYKVKVEKLNSVIVKSKPKVKGKFVEKNFQQLNFHLQVLTENATSTKMYRIITKLGMIFVRKQY